MPAPDVPAVRAALDAIAATDAAEALDAGAATRSFDGGRDWQAFCRRVAEGAATPSCVIDFPYADTGAGGLNLQGDDRLLERMVCFHDRQRGAPEAWLVVVHVHTLLRWGDRLRLTAAERLQAVTSVNARHAAKTLRIDESDGKAYTREEFVQEYGREKGMARWDASRECFQQEHRKFHVVPKSKELVHEWKSLFGKGATREIVWNPHKADSVPPRDAGAKWIYDDVRKVLQAGDALCREATIAHNVHQSQKAMRGGASGGREVEYEVVGVAEDDTEPVRAKTCKACGLRFNECACSHAASKGGAGGARAPYGDVWKEEPDWASLPPPESPTTPLRILFVGAINDDEVRLSLEQEVKEIEAAFKSTYGSEAWLDKVVFRHYLFVDMAGLVECLLDFRPVAVHFSCHGQRSFLSLYQDEVSVRTLRDALKAWCEDASGTGLRFAIANLCNSAPLAQALADYIDFVIGHDQPVLDSAAIDFARVLYKALGSGRSLRNGFELARAVKDCGMYCLRGRKDAGKFVFPKPESEPATPMTSFNVKEAGGYQARAEPEQRLEAWLAADSPCPTFVLWGLGGSGKSTLGRTFAARLVERDSAAPVRLVFLLSAASMEQDYLGLLGVLSSDAAGSGSLALAPEKVRGKVHELLRSAGWRRKWLCVLDDLPPPAAQPMEEAGLDWLVDEFPWEHGRTIITTRAAEWAEDAELFGAAARSDGLQVGSFAEDEASSLVHGKVPLWADLREGVRELVQYLHCYPLAVAQAAEYARVYKTAAPGEYLEELKRAGLKLAKDRRRTKKGEYPVTFPEVVQLSLDKILQSDDAHAEDAGQALRKLALVDAEAIPLDLLTAAEKKAVFLLQEHSLATVDDRGAAAMHALTQLVVREQLTQRAQRPALLAALAAVLKAKMSKYDRDKPATWFVGRRYASHVAAVSERAREWGLLPTAPVGGGAGQPPPQRGAAGAPAGGAQGAGGLLGSIFWMCLPAGSFYKRNGQYAQALRMHGQALDSALAVWGPGHRHVAASCANLGLVYQEQGQYARALELHQRALEIQIRVCGHDHLDVAKSYGNMAIVYNRQGKYEQALDYHKKSLSIKITTLGSDHPDVAISKFNIALLLRNMDKAAESKQMFTEAAGIFRAALGADHPHTKMAERRSAET